MSEYNLLKVCKDRFPSRYYMDGKRVSEDCYRYALTVAKCQDTFHTTVRVLKGEEVWYFRSVIYV